MNQQRGFSLLEVLVSMLIIMIGALGIAGMQLLAITSTENARYQNVATMLGVSLTAAMQANVAYWGSPPAAIAVDGESSTGGPAAFGGTCLGLANVCTAPQMAAYDLKAWGKDVADLLPSGKATITCPAGNSPAICTLKLTWSERNVSLHNADTTETGELATGTKADNTYETLVSIL
jgi:type IV pilus assembly protein PilV